MAEPDTSLYELFGIGKANSIEDLRRQYRKLCMKYHPDRGGDAAKFQEIQVGYDILMSPSKRRAYDAGEIGPDGKPRAKSPEEELRDVAIQGLRQMLDQLLEIDQPIFATLFRALDKHDSDAQMLLGKLRRDIVKLERRMKFQVVFKGKDGEANLLQELANTKIARWKQQIEGTERSIKIFAEARKIASALRKHYEEVQGVERDSGFSLYSMDGGAGLDSLIKEVFGAGPTYSDPKDQSRTGPNYRSPYGSQPGRRK